MAAMAVQPHLHVIATSGGWMPRQAVAPSRLCAVSPVAEKVQWHLLTMLRQTVKMPEMRGWWIRVIRAIVRVVTMCKRRGPRTVSEFGHLFGQVCVSPRSRSGALIAMMGTGDLSLSSHKSEQGSRETVEV